MKKKVSRAEVNKEIRHVLARHVVNISELSFGSFGREIRLTGTMIKTNGGTFTVGQIQAMLDDFSRILPGLSVIGDCTNWSFTSEGQIQQSGGGTEKETEEDVEESAKS